MRASWRWLKELSGIDDRPEEMAESFTRAGLEVEHVEHKGERLQDVVVAEVETASRVPERDRLTRVTVHDGGQSWEVICGAPNVPEPGGRVALARVGAELPNGLTIAERKVGGVLSRGMLCSEAELDAASDSEGILALPSDPDVPLGTPIHQVLGLQDAVLHFGLTPNRPDALGHVGLARDLAAIRSADFSTPSLAAPVRVSSAEAAVADTGARFSMEPQWASSPPDQVAFAWAEVLARAQVDVRIAAPQRCPRYGAAIVMDAQVRPSPFALRYRLHCLGVRAISNVVDISNLVMLEYGHPIHAFDLEKLAERMIEVRVARAGERLRTLDGSDRALTDDDLLICDGKGPVALAGIMGGENSEVGADTRAILIECAYFDPRSVRRTARRLGLHTEASHRFERGVDPAQVRTVLARAAQWMADLGEGVAALEGIDRQAQTPERTVITFRAEQTDRLLGFSTPPERGHAILRALGCEVHGTPDEASVTAPTWRPDLRREEDLIEEVARIQGYDRIPAEVPAARPSAAGTAEEVRFVRRLKEAAAASGLHEAITYAFVSPRDLKSAAVSRETVPVLNPLSEERSVLRTSLLPGLASAAGHSQRRQVGRIALYEVGRIFSPAPDGPLPLELSRFAFLLLGTRDGWMGERGSFDFYDGKGFLELIAGQVGRFPLEFIAETGSSGAPPGWLHPRRGARVRAGDRSAGWLGELHPQVAGALGLEGRPVFAEVSVEALFAAAQAQGTPQVVDLARFPPISRDIALVVDEALTAGELAAALRKAAGGLADDVRAFDVYRGGAVPEGKKSIAFRVTYLDRTRTLTDAEIDKVHARVSRRAEKDFRASIR